MLVLRHDSIALTALDGDRHDLPRVEAGILRLLVPHLAAIRERVLVGAGNLEFLGDVFPGFRHRVGAIDLLHLRVHEAPPDGGVVDFVGARERLRRFAHHERRAGHAFDAASQHELRIAGLDRARGGTDGIQARSAKAVDGRTRHRGRQARQQHGHARDIAVVFAGLIGAAHDAIVQRIPIDAGVTLFQRFDRNRTEVVGSHIPQCPGITADRRAGEVANIGFGHGSVSPWEMPDRFVRRRPQRFNAAGKHMTTECPCAASVRPPTLVPC